MIVKRPARAGCEGCIYNNSEDCPADPNDGQLTFNFKACSEEEMGAIIFVEEENE